MSPILIYIVRQLRVIRKSTRQLCVTANTYILCRLPLQVATPDTSTRRRLLRAKWETASCKNRVNEYNRTKAQLFGVQVKVPSHVLLQIENHDSDHHHIRTLLSD